MRALGSNTGRLGRWLMIIALGGCFSDSGPDDGETTLTTAAGSSSDPSAGTGSSTGTTEGTTGASEGEGTTEGVSSDTTEAATTSGTASETTAAEPTTGSGSTDSSTGGAVPCDTPNDCDSDEFCDFPNVLCGDFSTGVCQPRPDVNDCSAEGIGVLGCDCEMHLSECHAHAAGTDVRGQIIDC